MLDWITGEATANAPLGRPKPAEAAAFPWATVALTARAPAIRFKARRCPPASHTATLHWTCSASALALAACIIRLASARVSAMSCPPWFVYLGVVSHLNSLLFPSRSHSLHC
jgi:hypothetical protein